MKKKIQQVSNYQHRKSIKDFLLAMRITTLLLFSIVFHSMADKDYSQYDKTEIMIYVEHVNQPQRKTITGTVVDENGTSIIGANIVEKGTSNGTITDIDGNFRLDVENEAILQITYIGYLTQEINISYQTSIDIVLQEDTQALEEVVVIGYGSIQRKDLTGAVSSIEGTEIQKIKGTQLSQALQGSIPGLMVTRSSSMPAASATIRVRGVTSIGDSDPLIIVDGIPYANIDDVNPNDIQDVTVLKDAASASIYGARAAAGVILITTKNAKEGETSFEFDVSFGFEKPTEFPSPVGVIRYLEMANEMTWNDAGNPEGVKYPLYSQDEVENWIQYNKTNPNAYPITDWIDLLINDSAPRQRHQFALTYGGQKIKSRASINYENTDALYDHRSYERITARVNNNIKFSDYLSSSIDFSFNRSISKSPTVNPIQHTQRYAPIYAAFWEDGRLAGGKDGANMYAMLHYGGFDNNWNNKFTGRISLEFKPIDNLIFTGVISPYFYFRKEKQFTKQIPYYAANDPTALLGYINGYTQTSLREQRAEEQSFTKQWYANYFNNFKGHNLNIMGGYEDYTYFREAIEGESDYLELSNYPYMDVGNPEYMRMNGGSVESAYRSFFGRLMYDYNKRYFFQFNARYDGSSRFHRDHRWSFFPSLSTAWNISEEPFMQNVKYLSHLKLRGSLGSLGNERIGNYPYQSSISFTNALFWTGNDIVSKTAAAQVGYAMTNISWETTETWDIGLDAYFLNNRLQFTGDYYYKKTKDMLLSLQIPMFSGYTNPQQNAGIMSTKGWEFKLSWHDKIGKVGYSVSANLSDYVSKMGNLSGTVFLGDQIIKEGSEYNEWYGYVSEGIFQSQEEVENSALLYSSVKPGDIKYKDISGPEGVPDGKITPEYDKVLLDSSLPRFLYGGNINLDYKNFDLSFIFQGVGKQKSRITPNMVRPFYSWWSSPSKVIDGNYWSMYNTEVENLNAKYPRLSYQSAESNNYEMSDFWLINGAYFRLKNITLGYTLPSKIVSKIGMSNVRIYTTVSDIFKIDNYPKGWDPEATHNSYISSTYNFGISIKF
ncbi:MAG: TonB-dependent receptor [Tannerellaceae bacterium]|jgi:TonB-linked SusC/RagA family outer membrane protein|nr:TonB-dependent receptor [Tannerellaceae bacterium]